MNAVTARIRGRTSAEGAEAAKHRMNMVAAFRTCKGIVELFSGAHSPPCKGGVAAASMKSRAATEAPQTGWSLTSQCFKTLFRNITCERPPRPRRFRNGTIFDGADTPPSQGGEYARP